MNTNTSANGGDGRVALVTGASGGIGQAVAERLAKDGFSVVVGYSGNVAKAKEVVGGIEAAGGKATGVQADISKSESVASLFEHTMSTYGRLDVVVHSAGIMPLAPIAQGDVAMFDHVIATNLRGTFLIFYEAAKRIAEGGRIIAFSSSVLARSFPTYGAYIASKEGVEGLVRVLANEMRGRKVTVNAVAPGPVETPLFTKGKTPEQMAEMAKMNPMERLGQPDDITGVVSFLAGPDGAWVNAQVLRANGGFA